MDFSRVQGAQNTHLWRTIFFNLKKIFDLLHTVGDSRRVKEILLKHVKWVLTARGLEMPFYLAFFSCSKPERKLLSVLAIIVSTLSILVQLNKSQV
jgi:hypothetical protein